MWDFYAGIGLEFQGDLVLGMATRDGMGFSMMVGSDMKGSDIHEDRKHILRNEDSVHRSFEQSEHEIH